MFGTFNRTIVELKLQSGSIPEATSVLLIVP